MRFGIHSRHIACLTGFLYLALWLFASSSAWGAVDLAGAQPDGAVKAIASDGKGGVYIGGDFKNVGTVSRPNLAHIGADGSLDPSWNPTIEAVAGVSTIVVEDDGVYVVGERVSVLDPMTGAKKKQYPDVAGIINAMAITDTKVIIGGEFDQVDGQARTNLASFDRSSGNLSNWKPKIRGGNSLEGEPSVNGVVTAGGKIYIGGNFSRIDSTQRTLVASFDLASGKLTRWNPGVTGNVGQTSEAAAVYTLLVRAGKLYVGGDFHAVGKTRRGGVAVFNVSSGRLTSFRSSVAGFVWAIEIRGKSVYLGGAFSKADRQRRHSLAVTNITSGALTSTNPFSNCKSPCEVNSIATSGDTIFIGGSFKFGDHTDRLFAL